MSLSCYTIKFIPTPEHLCKVDIKECRERSELSRADLKNNVHIVEFKLPSFSHAITASEEVQSRFSHIDLGYTSNKAIRVVSISEKLI